MNLGGFGFDRPNPKYPEGGIEGFVLDMISLKQQKIAKDLGVSREYGAVNQARRTAGSLQPTARTGRTTPAKALPARAIPEGSSVPAEISADVKPKPDKA